MIAQNHPHAPSSQSATRLICGQWIERWLAYTFTIVKILMPFAPKNSCGLKEHGFLDAISAQMTYPVFMNGTFQDCLTSELRPVNAFVAGSIRTFSAPQDGPKSLTVSVTDNNNHFCYKHKQPLLNQHSCDRS